MKMNPIGLILAGLILLFYSGTGTAQSESGVLYQQRVRRDDIPLGELIQGSKGIIFLTTDSIIFKALKKTNIRINFSAGYNQVARVKKVNYLFLPNRILIRLKSDEKYRIFTYKRKRIMEEIMLRIN